MGSHPAENEFEVHIPLRSSSIGDFIDMCVQEMFEGTLLYPAGDNMILQFNGSDINTVYNMLQKIENDENTVSWLDSRNTLSRVIFEPFTDYSVICKKDGFYRLAEQLHNNSFNLQRTEDYLKKNADVYKPKISYETQLKSEGVNIRTCVISLTPGLDNNNLLVEGHRGSTNENIYD